MTGSNVRSLAIAFTVGLLGWLSVEVVQPNGELVFFAAFLVGAIAGTLTRQRAAIVGLVGGMLAAYPIALAGRVIVNQADGWAIYVAMAGGIAVAGFVAARLAGQGRRSRFANGPGAMSPSGDIHQR